MTAPTHAITHRRVLVTAIVVSVMAAGALAYGVASPPSYDEQVFYLPTLRYLSTHPWQLLTGNYGTASPAGPPLWLAVQMSLCALLGRTPDELLTTLRLVNLVCGLSAFVLLVSTRPRASSASGETAAILALAGVMFGGPQLLDLVRIKQVFPAWLLAVPILMWCRSRDSARPAASAWMAATSTVLVMWTNHIMGAVVWLSLAGSLTWTPAGGDRPAYARALRSSLAAGLIAGFMLLLIWGDISAPSGQMAKWANTTFAQRVVAQMTVAGWVWGPWALAFARRLGWRGVLGSAGFGLLGAAVSIFPNADGAALVGPLATSIRFLSQDVLWISRVIQGATVALSAALCFGLILGERHEERAAGLVLAGVFLLLGLSPYLNDRYYFIALGPWLLGCGLPIFERQYAGWNGRGRALATMLLCGVCASGVIYAFIKLHQGYGGVVAQ